VPLDPAYKAGLAGHIPVKVRRVREVIVWEVMTCEWVNSRVIIATERAVRGLKNYFSLS